VERVIAHRAALLVEIRSEKWERMDGRQPVLRAIRACFVQLNRDHTWQPRLADEDRLLAGES
jgi:hypothetical protein